jgi:hypothetical protein
MRTGDNLATGWALNMCRKAAAVEQQYYLPTVGKCPVHCLVERSTDGAALGMFLQPQVNGPHGRKGSTKHAPRHRQQAILFLFCSVPAFQ